MRNVLHKALKKVDSLWVEARAKRKHENTSQNMIYVRFLAKSLNTYLNIMIVLNGNSLVTIIRYCTCNRFHKAMQQCLWEQRIWPAFDDKPKVLEAPSHPHLSKMICLSVQLGLGHISSDGCQIMHLGNESVVSVLQSPSSCPNFLRMLAADSLQSSAQQCVLEHSGDGVSESE